jgi:cell division protein FtsN
LLKKNKILLVVGSVLILAGASIILYSYLSPINYFILDDALATTEQPSKKTIPTSTQNIEEIEEKEAIKEETPVVIEEKKTIEKKVETQAAPQVASGKYYIISGSFGSEENANIHVKNLKLMGYKNAKMLGKTKNLYKVSIDEFNTREEADIKLKEIKDKEQPTAWILYL